MLVSRVLRLALGVSLGRKRYIFLKTSPRSDTRPLSVEQSITVRPYPCLLARQVDQFDELEFASAHLTRISHQGIVTRSVSKG